MTDPATCRAFEEDLSALLDGELEPAREAEVRAHTAGCARCAERLARLARVDEALRSLPDAETPADLAERLRVRLDEERRRWIPLAATALAAAAALALYLVFGRPRPAEEPTFAERERPAPEREIAWREVPPEPLPDELVSGPELEAVEAASDEELALALDLDTLADLDVIERLDVLEQLAALDGAG